MKSVLRRSISDEPFQKRLRNDHKPDSLSVTLEPRATGKVSSPSMTVSHVAKVLTADVWKPLRVKHIPQEDQSGAKSLWEMDMKEKWTRAGARISCNRGSKPEGDGLLFRCRSYSFSSSW